MTCPTLTLFNMRVQEMSARKGKPGVARKQKPWEKELRIRPTVAAAQDDLRRFIMGQMDTPDSPLVLEEIIKDIDALMDDELITALENLEEHYHFNFHDRQQDEASSVHAAHVLLVKLRELQKARLRDAIERVARPTNQ